MNKNPRVVNILSGAISALVLVAGCSGAERPEPTTDQGQTAVRPAGAGPAAGEGATEARAVIPYAKHDARKVRVSSADLADSFKNRIEVKFREGTGVRSRQGALTVASSAGAARVQSDIAAINRILAGARRHTALRMHDQVPEETLASWKVEGERATGVEVPDLNLWHYIYVDVDSAQALADIVNALNGIESVEIAYASPLPAPAPSMDQLAAEMFNAHVRTHDRLPWPSGERPLPAEQRGPVLPQRSTATPGSPSSEGPVAMAAPNYEPNQLYRTAAPTGIDIDYLRSWYWNATGINWGYTDCEYDWNQAHVDLAAISSSSVLVNGTPTNIYEDHGTAVVGILSSTPNGSGTTGLAYQSAVRLSTEYPTTGYNRPSAITSAANQFWKGAVILLEMQTTAGFDCNSSGTGDGNDLVPAEWNTAVKDAVRNATANGRIVVAAAGNGNCNLDLAGFNNEFQVGNAATDSGSIIVGAAERDTRNKASFSTYGSRVDAQSEGDWKVTTTGYGGLYSAEGYNAYYTSSFSGTSSASPIVTSAAVVLSSILWQYHGSIYAPREIREVLRRDGTPQGTGGRVGPRPDMRKHIQHMHSRHVELQSSDFDGDGRSDYAVWRPSNGTWYIRYATGATAAIQWGVLGDIPVPANVTGDARAELIVYRPSNGTWWVRNWDGSSFSFQWGTIGDIPLAMDVDGNGYAEYVAFRQPNTEGQIYARWYIRYGNGFTTTNVWGEQGDIPLARDFDADGRDDFATFRGTNGTWYILYANGSTRTVQWGVWGDIPLTYKSNNRFNIAVWRPSNATFYAQNLTTGVTAAVQWGVPGDVPRFGDTDNSGTDEYIVYRPGNGTWYNLTVGTTIGWGLVGDIALAR